MRFALTTCLILLLGMTSSAWAEGGKKGQNGRRRPSKEKIIERFDLDGDGRLNETERAAAKKARAERQTQRGEGAQGRPGEKGKRPGRPSREQILARFDEDGDGKLNAAEREQAHEAHRARQQKGGQGERGRQARPQGGGQGERGHRGPSPEMRKKLLQRFDADGNGQLTGQERERAHAAMRKMHQQRSGQSGGRRGGGPGGKGLGGKQGFRGSKGGGPKGKK